MSKTFFFNHLAVIKMNEIARHPDDYIYYDITTCCGMCDDGNEEELDSQIKELQNRLGIEVKNVELNLCPCAEDQPIVKTGFLKFVCC